MDNIPTSLAKALAKLQAEFPGFEITAEAKASTRSLDPKQIIKDIVSELKTTYTDIAVSLAKNTYGAFAIINIKSKTGADDLAWYMNEDTGYVGESIYHDIYKHIKNNAALVDAGMRVHDFIDSRRAASFEIYI